MDTQTAPIIIREDAAAGLIQSEPRSAQSPAAAACLEARDPNAQTLTEPAAVEGNVLACHGGTEVLNEPGKDSTSRFRRPATEDPACQTGSRPKLPKSRGAAETILVVEDEPALRSMVCHILRGYGYTTLEAGSGPEAIPIWRSHADRIDLLFTDMVMPGQMTGRVLAEKLQAEKASLKVVYTSGYSVEMFDNDFLFKRGTNFLAKPYPPDALLKILRDCLDS